MDDTAMWSQRERAATEDPIRKLLIAVAHCAYDDADGRPVIDTVASTAERERLRADGQWWWLDDRQTDIGSATFFCQHVLGLERAQVAKQLEARWERLGILVPPSARLPLLRVLRHTGRRVGSEWPRNTGRCHGVPNTDREACAVPVGAAKRRCPICAALQRAQSSLAYYHAKRRATHA